MDKLYKYLISGAAYDLFPTETFFGLLKLNEKDVIEIPKCHPFDGSWGKPVSLHIMEKGEYPLPIYLDMVYLSLVEKKFYSIETEIPSNLIHSLWDKGIQSSKELINKFIIIGMAPYGGIAVWVYDKWKSYIVLSKQAEEVKVSFKEFAPITPYNSLDDYCEHYIVKGEEVGQRELPLRCFFDKHMQQFSYRYVLSYDKWGSHKEGWQRYSGEEIIPELDYIEEALFDGTHDKLHDGGLLNYHQAGKPKKLAMKWHVGKSEYTAYFWFEDEEIRTVFDRFYGAHPETKTDFMIRIDSEKNKYELALYRYGLKEPQVISERAYQLLVFKNKFEYYRSENYDQPRGAWIW